MLLQSHFDLIISTTQHPTHRLNTLLCLLLATKGCMYIRLSRLTIDPLVYLGDENGVDLGVVFEVLQNLHTLTLRGWTIDIRPKYVKERIIQI